MSSVLVWCMAIGVACAATSFAADLRPVPTKAEMALAHEWVAKNLARAKSGQAGPVSFVYDGKPSGELLAGWSFKETTKKLDSKRTQRTQTYTDPATGLEVRIVLVQYRGFPTVEWTAYLKNTGTKDTPILENIQGLDMVLQRSADESEFVLHHNQGSHTAATDFQPFLTALTPGVTKRIGGAGGCPMSSDMPYFNLEWGGRGMIVVMGWTGQPMSEWTRDSGGSLRVTVGQEKTHLKLLPGEEIRTPLVVLQFWQGGDVVRSQNIWRRWMIAHNLPRPGGKPMPPVTSTTATDLFPNYVGNAADEVNVIDGCSRCGLKADYWWIDAGWYPCGDHWWNTGTWEPDPTRYPKGLKEVADRAHANGMKLTVWFEPERNVGGTWLPENHPEWIFGGKDGGIVNIGIPAAREWIVNRVDKLMTGNAIDMYRQDYNVSPLQSWQRNDVEDRQGITENLYVQGLYTFWDELKRRRPGMPMDNCAGGGRRNDIEMMRRGFPLSKTDFAGGTSSSQCQLHGLAPWLPYFGAGSISTDPYVSRSNIASWTATACDTRKDDLDYGHIRRFLDDAHRVAPYLMGDFYPLTSYSLDENIWMAWQFDLPEKGKGIVQAFRRPENTDESMTYKLRALDPKATYELTDFDAPGATKMTGSDLMSKGLTITTKQKPSAAIITYKKL